MDVSYKFFLNCDNRNTYQHPFIGIPSAAVAVKMQIQTNHLYVDKEVHSISSLSVLISASLGIMVYVFFNAGSEIFESSGTYLILSACDETYGIQQIFGTGGTYTWGILR